MTTLVVTVDQHELEFLLHQLVELEGVNYIRDLLDETMALLLNRIRTRFLNTEAPDGSIWPVSAAAIKRNFNGKTLFDTGTLFHSIQGYVTADNERQIGTNVFYGVFHQFGTKFLPERVFLGASDNDLSLIQGLMVRRVQAALEGVA